MNVLLIGSGAREHALALAFSASPLLTKLYVAPGNPGCAKLAEAVALNVEDHDAVSRFCEANGIGLVVVGPEAPLVAGIADALAAKGVFCFGPSKAAAQLEGSKSFTKAFCDEFNVPTAAYRRFSSAAPALEYVHERGAPIVVKADGLAAGKGVVVAATAEEAAEAVRDCFAGRFGSAGAEIVIEDLLLGEEASFFALSDGVRAVAFGAAQDHKRVGDGDTGPNTGGMGAYSPTRLVDGAMERRVMHEIIEPAIAGMRARGTPFRGVLFAGLMIGVDGPKLIEFNVRFGDPEAQVLFARLQSDPLELLLACARGDLGSLRPDFADLAAVGIVMATTGYPGAVETGSQIRGLDDAEKLPGVQVLQGATRQGDSEVLANGGRVLTVVATDADMAAARDKAYRAIKEIRWPQGFYRSDIGLRAIAKG